LLSVVLALLVSPQARAQGTPEEYFKQGRDAVQKKEWSRARELLAKAWALKKSFDTAALLGQAEMKLDQHRDAAEHLDYALRNFPNQEPTPDARKRIEEAAKAARSKVFALTVTTNIDAAELSVDGAPIGRAPLGAELFLDAGKHVVAAKLEGYDVAQREIDAKAGASASVRLELAKLAGPAAASDVSTEASNGTRPGATGGPKDATAASVSPHKKSAIPIYAAGAIALVGLGSALYFELSRNANAKDADELSGRVDPKGCGSGTATPQECADLHDKNTSANRASNLRDISLLGAGVAVAAGVGYFLWPTSQRSTARAGSRALVATPRIAPTHAGLSLSGTF
jgi:tetratricopeptide (TPR) repeat protein